jgi:hypothetical protein
VALPTNSPAPVVSLAGSTSNQSSKRVAERLGAIYERTFEFHGSNYEHWVHYRPAPVPDRLFTLDGRQI